MESNDIIRYLDRDGLKSLIIGFPKSEILPVKLFTQFKTHHYDVVGRTACYYDTEKNKIMVLVDEENTVMMRDKIEAVYKIQISPDSTRVLYIHGRPGYYPIISIYNIGSKTSQDTYVSHLPSDFLRWFRDNLNISTDFMMEKFLVLRFINTTIEKDTFVVYDLDSGKAEYNKEKTDRLLKSPTLLKHFTSPVFLQKMMENENFDARELLREKVFLMHIKIQTIQKIVSEIQYYGQSHDLKYFMILDIMNDALRVIADEYKVTYALKGFKINMNKNASMLTLKKDILEYTDEFSNEIVKNTKMKRDLSGNPETGLGLLKNPHFVSENVIEMDVILEVGYTSKNYTIHVDFDNFVLMEPEMKMDDNWNFRCHPYLYNRRGIKIPRDKSMKYIVAENNIYSKNGEKIEGTNQEINVEFLTRPGVIRIYKYDVAQINGYIYEFKHGLLRKRLKWTTLRRLTQTFLKLATTWLGLGDGTMAAANAIESSNLEMFNTLKFDLPHDRMLFTRETLKKYSKNTTAKHHPLEVCIGIDDGDEYYDDKTRVRLNSSDIYMTIPDKEFLTIVPMWLHDEDLDFICKRVEYYLRKGYIIWNCKPEFDGENRFQRFLTYEWAQKRMSRKRGRDESDEDNSKKKKKSQDVSKALAELSLRY